MQEGKHAIIFSANPCSKKTYKMITNIMRDALEEIGAPADLVQIIEELSIDLKNELMAQTDLVETTSGGLMFKPP